MSCLDTVQIYRVYGSKWLNLAIDHTPLLEFIIFVEGCKRLTYLYDTDMSDI